MNFETRCCFFSSDYFVEKARERERGVGWQGSQRYLRRFAVVLTFCCCGSLGGGGKNESCSVKTIITL